MERPQDVSYYESSKLISTFLNDECMHVSGKGFIAFASSTNLSIIELNQED